MAAWAKRRYAIGSRRLASFWSIWESSHDKYHVNSRLYSQYGVRRIAEIAYQVNESTENIGARRLHTVLERLLDVISFEAPDHSGESYEIDAAYVNTHLEALAGNEDLSRYIL